MGEGNSSTADGRVIFGVLMDFFVYTAERCCKGSARLSLASAFKREHFSVRWNAQWGRQGAVLGSPSSVTDICLSTAHPWSQSVVPVSPGCCINPSGERGFGDGFDRPCAGRQRHAWTMEGVRRRLEGAKQEDQRFVTPSSSSRPASWAWARSWAHGSQPRGADRGQQG